MNYIGPAVKDAVHTGAQRCNRVERIFTQSISLYLQGVFIITRGHMSLHVIGMAFLMHITNYTVLS